MNGIGAGVRSLAGSWLLCLLAQTFTFVFPSPSHHESGESSSRGLDQLPTAISACELGSVQLSAFIWFVIATPAWSQLFTSSDGESGALGPYC